MTKTERIERMRELETRSPRDLADVIVQAEDALDKRRAEIAKLRREVERAHAEIQRLRAAGRK